LLAHPSPNAIKQNQIPSDQPTAMHAAFGDMSLSTQGSSNPSLLPPPLLSLDPNQQQAAFQMTHYLNSLMCMVSEHFTSLESLKAEVTEMKEKSRMAGGRYIQNQQLEEIRLKEDNLDRCLKKWMADKDQREKETKAEEERIQMERDELANIRTQIALLHYYFLVDLFLLHFVDGHLSLLPFRVHLE
jgi:hypothetical protein